MEWLPRLLCEARLHFRVIYFMKKKEEKKKKECDLP